MAAGAHQDVPVSLKNDQFVCAGAGIHDKRVPTPHMNQCESTSVGRSQCERSFIRMTRVAQCEQRDDFVDQLAHDTFSCSPVISRRPPRLHDLPTPVCDMTTPPLELHRATATSRPLRASSTEADAASPPVHTESAYKTPLALCVRSRTSAVPNLPVFSRRTKRRDSVLRVSARHARSHALPPIRRAGCQPS